MAMLHYRKKEKRERRSIKTGLYWGGPRRLFCKRKDDQSHSRGLKEQPEAIGNVVLPDRRWFWILDLTGSTLQRGRRRLQPALWESIGVPPVPGEGGEEGEGRGGGAPVGQYRFSTPGPRSSSRLFFVRFPHLFLDLRGQRVEEVLLHHEAGPLQLPALAELHGQTLQPVASQLELREPGELPEPRRQRLQAVVAQVQSAKLLALEQLVGQALDLWFKRGRNRAAEQR